MFLCTGNQDKFGTNYAVNKHTKISVKIRISVDRSVSSSKHKATFEIPSIIMLS